MWSRWFHSLVMCQSFVSTAPNKEMLFSWYLQRCWRWLFQLFIIFRIITTFSTRTTFSRIRVHHWTPMLNIWSQMPGFLFWFCWHTWVHRYHTFAFVQSLFHCHFRLWCLYFAHQIYQSSCWQVFNIITMEQWTISLYIWSNSLCSNSL